MIPATVDISDPAAKAIKKHSNKFDILWPSSVRSSGVTSIGVDTLISWTSIRQLVKTTKKTPRVLKQASFIFIRVACFGQVWSEFLWFLLLPHQKRSKWWLSTLMSVLLIYSNGRCPQSIQCSQETHMVEACLKIRHADKELMLRVKKKKSRWSEVCGLREVHSWACVHGTTWTKPPCKVRDSGPLLLPWVWPVSAPGSVSPLKEADVQHDNQDIAQNLEEAEELQAYQRWWGESCKAPAPCARQWTDTGQNPWPSWTGPVASDPGSPLGKWPAGRARSPRMSKRAPDQPCGTSQVPSGCFPVGIPHVHQAHFSPKL